MFLLEFPQNLIGFIAFLIFTKIRKCSFYKYKDAFVTHVGSAWGALTLSRYIFADDGAYSQPEVVLHEYGHRMQSKRLLVLYLLIIAVPSLIWASGLFDGYRKKHKINYYRFYTEAWANRLSGARL